MKKEKIKTSLLIISILLMITSSPAHGIQDVLSEEKLLKSKVIIAIDEYHAVLFGYKELRRALKELNYSLPIPVEVVTLKGELNSTFLDGVDILLIPPNNGTIRYMDYEVRAVAHYLIHGGNVIILGAPIIGDFRTTISFFYINLLISDLASYNVTIGFKFYSKNERSDLIYDYVNNNGSLIILQRDTVFSEENLKDALLANISEPIYIQTASLEITGNPKELITIRTLPTACSINIDNEIRYDPDGFVIFAAQNIERGKIVGVGFGQIFTNFTSPLGSAWIDTGGASKFFINLIKWVLDIEKWRVEKLAPVKPVYIAFLVIPLPAAILIPVVAKREKEIKRKREEKKKEIKISEILRKIREEEKGKG